jgi:hypothetical protein
LQRFSSVSNFVIGGDRGAIALFDHFPFLASFRARAIGSPIFKGGPLLTPLARRRTQQELPRRSFTYPEAADVRATYVLEKRRDDARDECKTAAQIEDAVVRLEI